MLNHWSLTDEKIDLQDIDQSKSFTAWVRNMAMLSSFILTYAVKILAIVIDQFY